MQRRNALKLAASLPLVTAASCVAAAETTGTAPNVEKFKLNFAPHHGMFEAHAGKDILDQIRWAADQGFTAWEDNRMVRRNAEEQEAIGKLLVEKEMTMGIFVANKIHWKEPSLTLGAGKFRDEFLQSIRDSVAIAKRCNAKWMTVVPGFVNLKLEPMYQFANVMESLKQAAAILEPHNLTMVLEPLNYQNHPGLFLTKAAQAYALCKAVDSPACKILFDVYHQQIQEGNLIPNIDAAWDEIAYFQLGDNPGRKEPGTGEINFTNLLAHIDAKGYNGVFGMEHKNSKPGKDGELAVIKAYRHVDKK